MEYMELEDSFAYSDSTYSIISYISNAILQSFVYSIRERLVRLIDFERE